MRIWYNRRTCVDGHLPTKAFCLGPVVRFIHSSLTYNLGHKGWKKIILYTFCSSPPLCNVDKTFSSITSLHFTNIERGNRGVNVDTYSVGITIVISCFWHFPTQFVQGCRWKSKYRHLSVANNTMPLSTQECGCIFARAEYYCSKFNFDPLDQRSKNERLREQPFHTCAIMTTMESHKDKSGRDYF